MNRLTITRIGLICFYSLLALLVSCGSARETSAELQCKVQPIFFCGAYKSLVPEVPREELAKLKQAKESDIRRFHLSLGQLVRNRYDLWGENALTKFFRGEGLSHPDFMSQAFIEGFVEYLNERAVDMRDIAKKVHAIESPPPPPPPPPPER